MNNNNFILSLILLTSISFAQQKVHLKNLSLNSHLDHFGAMVIGKDIYFCHNLKSKQGRVVKDDNLGYVYTIYKGKVSDDDEIIEEEPLINSGNQRYNMSSATFTKDGRYMYFTSNHGNASNSKNKSRRKNNLLIQRAEFIEGKGWTNFEILSFCDVDHSYGQPALSPDDNTLYFIAKLDNTKGKSDIYKVSITNHKTYGKITRLNDMVNSHRTEIFPFVSSDNKLYFSSNREDGKGGLDIYMYDLSSGQDPKLLDEPINSRGNDFSFFLNDDLTSGYFTSRRYRGKGGDDLYYFTNYKH